MFVGHVAVGVVGARHPRMPLGTAVPAAQLPGVIRFGPPPPSATAVAASAIVLAPS